MICVEIDEYVPCLIDSISGEICPTEVIRIQKRQTLKGYNKKTGWYVNWSKLLRENEVYALVIRETNEFQGLVAIQEEPTKRAIHISWACASPENNKRLNATKRFIGVGGHLFAIAGNIAFERGYDGFVYGEASNSRLFEYYQKAFGAEPFPYGEKPHDYRITIDTAEMKKITEVYDYEIIKEKI